MGLIGSGSTVTVQAFLTDAGKKKIYESIENNASGFATKFGLGDSDANYDSIAGGYGTLSSGRVPEPSDFKPIIRSLCLYQGSYRPGIPVLLVGEDYGPDIYLSMSIGVNNTQVQKQFRVKTEWPKNTGFEEHHKLKIQNPGNMTDEAFKRLFTIATATNGISAVQFNGNATSDELDILLGESRTLSTIIPIIAHGATTNQKATIYLEIKQ